MILLLGLLLLTSCSVLPDARATPTRFARRIATDTPVTVAAPTRAPTPRAQPYTPSATLTETLIPLPSPTPTPIPTSAPPLGLRDDLPPLTLRDFPRPANDNGLGIHFLATGYYSEAELDKQIARMQALHLKWALVLYADENHLELAARKFQAAGMMVVWRKTLRPYQRYFGWGRDVEILQQLGMPPYMQLYNEPELPAEWEGQPIDPAQFMGNLLQAARDVYNAGGYPGIQLLDEDLLRDFINQVYARQGEALFRRMFFIPHPYGLNHPPGYVEDTNGVLGFRTFAPILLRRLGFVPPMLAGEGGWKVGSAEDNRFPPIDEKLHRDYTLAVFDWFRTGKMSNGASLPDYLFAFCMWMLAGADEAGAWYDAFNGDRTLTIQALQKMPAFVRKFSWER